VAFVILLEAAPPSLPSLVLTAKQRTWGGKDITDSHIWYVALYGFKFAPVRPKIVFVAISNCQRVVFLPAVMGW
jgi:hypothetical protein